MPHPACLSRRVFGAIVSAAALTLPSLALAQSYPSKAIEWVVPYPAGGGTDVVARTLAEAMGKTLGQPLVVVNKPGAATNIGAAYVAHAKPDGYTILSADTATLAANPYLYSKLGYNAEKDFASLGLTVRFPLILAVNPKVPAKNLKEFLAWARTQDAASYATPGAGSPHHLATELFSKDAGITFTHVPYRGAAPAVQDVVGGQVPFMFVDTASGQQFINGNKLRALGIASNKRVKNFEDVATLNEQGMKGFEAYAWQGLVAPAGTPREVVEKLNRALLAAMDNTEVKARLQALGLEAIPSSPAQMDKYATDERAKWSRVIKVSHLKLD
ncbi:MAG: tripartite tricarboxylate transporter substrate binding protein [Proteobacteria bacterium]|nr:tripartite tricarboxylate transporter substrate binding protein [Pseudomonadota bacterium]MBS0493785.1 tripartite tricarboxylate transporter substrate binding protein [Pseudomonadota bacterium]